MNYIHLLYIIEKFPTILELFIKKSKDSFLHVPKDFEEFKKISLENMWEDFEKVFKKGYGLQLQITLQDLLDNEEITTALKKEYDNLQGYLEQAVTNTKGVELLLKEKKSFFNIFKKTKQQELFYDTYTLEVLKSFLKSRLDKNVPSDCITVNKKILLKLLEEQKNKKIPLKFKDINEFKKYCLELK